jgi:hypothetical protein
MLNNKVFVKDIEDNLSIEDDLICLRFESDLNFVKHRLWSNS